jgi:site-specific DNA-methyltransferase (adenine-specific)
MDQALMNGKGITWLDDCRIPFENSGNVASNPFLRKSKGLSHKQSNDKNSSSYSVKNVDSDFLVNSNGRFPANLLVSDDILNDGKQIKSGIIESHHVIDKQKTTAIYGEYTNLPAGQQTTYGDCGDFSRYFDLDAWFLQRVKRLPVEVQRTFPFLIVPKASKEERNRGLEKLDNASYLDESRHDKNAIGCNNPRNRTGKLRKGNIHPTVKPLTLMSYLITLGSRPNDLILDPYVGSGTTALAAKMLGRRFWCCEKQPEYHALAVKRVGSLQTLFEFTDEPLRVHAQDAGEGQ